MVRVNAVTNCNQTAVCSAAQKGSFQAAKLLLEHGADPTIANELGQNALFTAAIGGHVQLMELMLQHGRLKISSSTNNTGATLLTAAADMGHTAAAIWLLQQQHMPVDDTDCEGMTALHFAARSGLAAMLTLLLQHGADIHKRSNHGQSALDLAAGQGFAQCVQTLITADASIVQKTDSTGVTAMHWAEVFEHADVVQVLLNNGAAAVINSKGLTSAECEPMTPLMLCKQPAIAKMLLEAGADVHITTDTSSNTCLHIAAAEGYTAAVICMLLKAGVNMLAVNSEGRTAAQLAHANGHALIATLLNRAAAQQQTAA
jgi:uncharacterized protein